MTDYLELLLEQRREEEEERDALRLPAEEAFPPQSHRGREADLPPEGWAEGRKSPRSPLVAAGAYLQEMAEGKGSPADSPLPPAGAAFPERAVVPPLSPVLPRETSELPLLTALSRKAEAGLLRRAAAVPLEAGAREEAEYGKTAGEMVEQLLGGSVDALAEPAADNSPLPKAELTGLFTQGAVPGSGGAAGLAQRLTQASLASAAPARAVFDALEDAPSEGTDWEEFDRRLERDARRYDGGMGMY